MTPLEVDECAVVGSLSMIRVKAFSAEGGCILIFLFNTKSMPQSCGSLIGLGRS